MFLAVLIFNLFISTSYANLGCAHFFGFNPKYGFAVPQKNPEDLKSIFYSNVYSTAQGRLIIRDSYNFLIQDSLVILERLKGFTRGKTKEQIANLFKNFENEYREGFLAHLIHFYGNAQPLIQFAISNGAVIDSRALSLALEVDTNLLDQLLQKDKSEINTLVPYSGHGYLVDIAIARNNIQAIRILRKHGALLGANSIELLSSYLKRYSLELPKSDLNRLLREAIVDQRILEAKLLLDAGASPNTPIINPYYLVEAHSPLELAIRAGNVDIVNMLRTYGANPKDPTAYPEPLQVRDAFGGSTAYIRLARRLHPNNTALRKALK